MVTKNKNKTKSKQKQKQKQKQTQIVNVNIHKPLRKTIYKRKEKTDKTDVSNIQQLPPPQYIYTSQVDSLTPQRFNKQGGREEEDDLMSKLKQIAKQYIDDKPKDITQPTKATKTTTPKEIKQPTKKTTTKTKPTIKKKSSIQQQSVIQSNDANNQFVSSLIIGKKKLKKTPIIPENFEKPPEPALIEEKPKPKPILVFNQPTKKVNYATDTQLDTPSKGYYLVNQPTKKVNYTTDTQLFNKETDRIKRLESLNLFQKDIQKIQTDIPKLNKDINILKGNDEIITPTTTEKKRRGRPPNATKIQKAYDKALEEQKKLIVEDD